MRSVHSQEEVALARPRGETGRRPGPLAQVDHHGRFRHSGQAEPLGHQVKAAPRCRGHGANTGVAGSYDHIDRRDFTLGVLDDQAPIGRMLRHILQYGRGGGHGVAGHELAAAHERSDGKGVVPRHRQALWRGDGCEFPGKALSKAALGQVVGCLSHLAVGLDDLGTLASKAILDDAEDEGKVEARQASGYGEHGGIGHHGATMLFSDLDDGNTNHQGYHGRPADSRRR